MATSTRKTPAKKTTPRKGPEKTSPRKPSRPGTITDLRKPLPTRRPTPTGPYTADEQTTARAALASAMAQLPIPVLAWHVPPNPDARHATAHLADGTKVTHTDPRPPAFTTPAQPPKFVAHVPCARGAVHQHQIHSARDLHQARTDARTCTARHSTHDQHDALTRGTRPNVTRLGEGLHRAAAAAADTQGLDLNQITAGLTARQTKEQHQP